MSFKAVNLGAFLDSDFTFQFSELSTPKSQFGVRKIHTLLLLRRWDGSVPCSEKYCLYLWNRDHLVEAWVLQLHLTILDLSWLSYSCWVSLDVLLCAKAEGILVLQWLTLRQTVT